MAPGAEVLAGLPRSQLGVAVGLVADGSEAASAQHALAHGRISPSGTVSVLCVTTRSAGRFPGARGWADYLAIHSEGSPRFANWPPGRWTNVPSTTHLRHARQSSGP